MKIARAYINSGNKLPTIYLLVGIIAFFLRLHLNYSQELIPGVNGGYYPVQVRSILVNGFLGFSDMPLLFYLDAFIVKFFSLFGFSITDTLIINVVKIIDSISIPLLLFPLYRIIRYEHKKTSIIFEASIISFAVLSFSPLILTSDLQKNALAITFLFNFLAYLVAYQKSKKISDSIFLTIFIILTGLTHFGTFIFAIFFLVLIIGFEYKSKAAIPLSVIIMISLALVAVFDIARLNRLLSVGSLIFEKPALLHGMLAPPDYLFILCSVLLAISGFIILRTTSINLLAYQKGVLFACILCLITFSFPLLDGEYFRRLSLLLFIPQVLIIIQIASHISDKQIKSLSIAIFIIVSISILAILGNPKQAVMNKEAYADLKKLTSLVKNDSHTIVIARHGLEWWTAWALKTRVGQDKAIEGDFYEKYHNIIFLNQIRGLSTEKQRTPFHEPRIPENSQIIYASNYFKAYRAASNQR